MSRMLADMKINVGYDVQDTSSQFAQIIQRYINKRYNQVMRAVNYQVINSTYTIPVISGTAEYTLPVDYKTEVACIDQDNNKPLSRVDFNYFQRENPEALLTSGEIKNYIIFVDSSGSTILRLVNIPTKDTTISFPYVIMPQDMSTTDSPLLPIEDILETGAIADAWRYKRQGAKAAQMEALFVSMLADFIWSRENQENYPVQFTPTTFNNNNLY